MKKFIFLMIFLFENASANTIEYYLHNPHLHATETKFNTTKGTWTTQFEYGTLSGVVSCLTNNYQTDEFQKYEQPLYDHNILVSGNEKTVHTVGVKCNNHMNQNGYLQKNTYSPMSVLTTVP